MHAGKNPNVYFGARPITTNDIVHERFVSLPPREAVRVADADGFAFRYINESDADWRLLHKGRLTSSRLSGLLNMWSPPNAKVLGFKGSSHEGHRRMIDAYNHLMGSTCDLAVAGEAGDVADIARHNLRAHLDANQRRSTPIDVDTDVSSDRILLEEMKLNKAKHLQSQGSIDRVRMSWGSAQEPSTILTLCEQFHDNSRYFLEVGLIEPDNDTLQRLGFEAGSLPPMGSTPDCMCVEASSREQAIEIFSRNLLGDTEEGFNGGLVHVVEIKNTAPFRLSSKKKTFELWDRGPRERVDAIMVPQLQLHMLCSGANAAFLVSRSATKGCNVFEMQRDDEFLKLLLGIVKVFYQRYCIPGRVPPKNALSDLKEHKQLLLKTREIAWRAKLREHIAHAPLAGADPRCFLAV